MHVGVGRYSSMKKWLIEEEQVSTYPERHRRRRGHESGQNLGREIKNGNEWKSTGCSSHLDSLNVPQLGDYMIYSPARACTMFRTPGVQ